MKLNIVIDASGIFYRSLFTVGNFGGSKKEKLLDTKKSQAIFMRKLASDFSTLIRDIDNTDRVIICLDSTSWRKSIEIKDGGYKEDRAQDEAAINWKAFFELTDKFASILSQKGYLISRVPGAEGDDLLFFWSRHLNSIGENVILITGDRDLLQTVGKHENNTWTIALDPVNSRKKVSLTQELLDYSLTDRSHNENVNIFDTSSWNSSEDSLTKIINNNNVNIVNIRKFCTMKVVIGDGGDSVPSVVTWRDKKDPTKIRKMTESNYSKILLAAPELENTRWQDLSKFVEVIAITMESLKKIEVDRTILLENLERNAKLVILSFETIPEQIVNNFNATVKDGVPDLIPVTGRDAILNGTEWWSTDNASFVPKSYDLFE